MLCWRSSIGTKLGIIMRGAISHVNQATVQILQRLSMNNIGSLSILPWNHNWILYRVLSLPAFAGRGFGVFRPNLLYRVFRAEPLVPSAFLLLTRYNIFLGITTFSQPPFPSFPRSLYNSSSSSKSSGKSSVSGWKYSRSAKNSSSGLSKR